MTRPCPGPIPTGTPRLSTPPGACDCHVHLLGPFDRFPLNDDRSYTPPEAPLEKLEALMRALNLERVVIVHGSAHGTDLRVTIDGLKRLGDRGRGVAVIEPDIADDELDRLHAVGFRGARLTTMLRGGVGLDNAPDIALRIARLGWHLQIFIDGPKEMVEIAPRLKGLPVPIVIDAMGRFKAGHGTSHPGFAALLDLLETQNCWVKLIGMNRLSVKGPPYADVVPFGKALLAARPDRIVWGTDWPHVMVWDHPVPDDAVLLDWLAEIGADAAQQRSILVDNPAQLYGFPVM